MAHKISVEAALLQEDGRNVKVDVVEGLARVSVTPPPLSYSRQRWSARQPGGRSWRPWRGCGRRRSLTVTRSRLP